MPKLIHACFVKNEAHCIERMLTSILPYVEESYILIDNKTTDNTVELARNKGCHVEEYQFENFAKAKNTLLKWVSGKSDWLFGLAPDETITPDFGEDLKKTVNEIHKSDIDGVYFARRHWRDLEMKKEYTKQNWYPDWQQRLLRNDYPRIHCINYVHEVTVGTRRKIWVKKDLHHFNMYWKKRIEYNWERLNVLYNDLKQEQRKDGGKNIWPN